MKDEFQIRQDEVSRTLDASELICPACGKHMKKAEKLINFKFFTIHKDCLEHVPFVITKEIRKFAGLDMKIFGLHFGPTEDKCVELTGNEAKALREEYGMIKSVDNKDGILWSDPDGRFLERFRGYFGRKAEHEAKIKAECNARARERASKKREKLQIAMYNQLNTHAYDY